MRPEEEVRAAWLEMSAAVSQAAIADKESQDALAKLAHRYRLLSPNDRSVVDRLLTEQLLSGDENVRFDALSLVEDFKIRTTIPALRRLADRLEYEEHRRNRRIGTWKSARQQQALARERARRVEADRRRFEQQQHVEQAAADAGVELPPVASARDPRTNPATQPARPASGRAGSGRRTPGQQVACGWCGEPALVRARGPLPKWCSPACRHRAWEQDRAARSGRAAVQVLDRYVTAVPDDGPSWIEHLSLLTGQLAAGPRPIADQHLDQLSAALELAQAAIANRTRWHERQHHN